MVALLVTSGAMVLACGKQPRSEEPETEPKRKQTVLVSEVDDVRAGKERARVVEAEVGILQAPELTGYVAEVGRRLVRHAPRRSFEYRFQIVDQMTPNAFALPGGHIYLSRGLLALSNSEDELANVLGHEITHAAARHAAGHQQRIQRINPFSLGFLRAAQIASYSREQERDADRGGQSIAARAGYDPEALTSFLRDLGNMERLQLGYSRLPGFLDTHPVANERLAAAAQRAEVLAWARGEGVARDRADYLRRLEGLVLGQNPAEGLFEGSRFVHPDLDFTIRFPQGWTTVNTRRAVGAISPKGDAWIVLDLAGRGDDPEAVARAFIEKRLQEIHAEVIRTERLEVAGGPAFRMRGVARTPQGTLSGMLTWFAHDGLIYRVGGVARSAVAEKYLGRAHSTTRSFRRLRPEERSAIQVRRLRVVTAREGETLEALSQRTGNAASLQVIAVANDLFVSSRLREGQLVKIGVSEPYVTSAGASRSLTDEPPVR
jgi:predicted Zn-dependent protease